jgi:uncharacterized membrane protein
MWKLVANKPPGERLMNGDPIVAVFPSRVILTKALDRIMELEYLAVRHAAIIAKARDGEIVILDDDISPNEGAIAGSTLGAAMTAFGLVQLGALTLPGIGPIIALGTGLVAGGLVGGAAGRIAAGLIDFDVTNLQVRTLAAELEAGHPALVLDVENSEDILPRLRDELKPYRAELVELLNEARYAVSKIAKS